MTRSRHALLCICLAASGMLALPLAGTAHAEYAFTFHPGPTAMVLPVNGFGQFHATLVNTGDQADVYHLSVTATQPASWTIGTCFDGICFPPSETEFTVPVMGDVLPGGEVAFDFDVTTLFDEGSAIYTVTFTSVGDPDLEISAEYHVQTPAGDYGMVLGVGDNVIRTTVNNFVQFHPVLYNAGLEADSYHVTLTRNLPDNWTGAICADGICYDPSISEIDIPAVGTLASGMSSAIDLDFTTLFDDGTGWMVMDIASNTDPAVNGRWIFWVTTLEGAVGVEPDVPANLLADVAAAPNPFNPRTEIRFSVGGDRAQPAVVEVFDVSGARVRRLDVGQVAPGANSVLWDGLTDSGRPAAAGTYLARVSVGAAAQTLKMSLVK